MGLPRALEAHAANLLGEAEAQYRRAYQQGQINEIFYQNFAALLKRVGKTDEARQFFEEGLTRYPCHPGIKRNYANLLRHSSPGYAIELYLEAVRLALSQVQDAELATSCLDDLIDLLRRRGLNHWAMALIAEVLASRQPSALVLMNLLLIVDQHQDVSQSKQIILEAIDLHLEKAPLLEAVGLDFSLAAHYLSETEHRRSLYYFESALKRIQSAKSVAGEDRNKLQEMIDTNSWNFACACLSLQDLRRGWSLFEHGLRTPADGEQRWQRALVKPFSASDLPLWRGEAEPNQRLLLLEEQAIGDGMMFLTLAPRLLDETRHLGLYVSPRLEAIYQRSFAEEIRQNRVSIFTKHDLNNGRLQSSMFDRQIPLGSICQHRFVDVANYSPRVPVLVADRQLADQLRREYLDHNNTPKRLVGVSWRGGGRGARIAQKSLAVETFAELMLQHPEIRFVDLQYGKTADQVKQWQDQGIDIIHDPRINPLKDMDQWLAQVRACDAVVSVANTTIHGAGGLNIPTQCLLSVHSDWRWFVADDVLRSYWYPSVGIARQHKTHRPSWQFAFQRVSAWLSDGCPMPEGPVVQTSVR